MAPGSGIAGRVLFFACIAAVCLWNLSPPIALVMGIFFGMALVHPFEAGARLWAKNLLQFSVVVLGFGMNAREVLIAGRAGFLYTIAGISFAMATGWALGRMMQVRPKVSYLISAGTAICGGSAIAALAGVIHPDDDEMAMSLGTIFALNSVALLIFPPIGFALRMTQNQFGLWSALAIHDTSSVVGAAARFGTQALAVATVVKLTRALWIFPLALGTAFVNKTKSRMTFPWFILLFCGAAAARAQFPDLRAVFDKLNTAGHLGLELTLFLIGTGISMKTLRRAGGSAMAQGIALWAIVASLSLLAIRMDWIAI